MSKRRLVESNLLAHLEEQLRFLKASADAFDAGHEGEAKRLAVSLRILLHDTERSHSLLGQLGRKSETFWDTAVPDIPGNVIAHGGLVALQLAPGSTQYTPLLDDFSGACRTDFEAWWNARVFREPNGTELSRRDLVTIAANQDGGAHVDPALDERYARFAHDNALLCLTVDDHGDLRPVDGAVGAAIRQIAHEVLRTLVPGYRKSRWRGGGAAPAALVGLPTVTIEKTVSRKLSRNDPCACGSGKKFKKCHGS